MPVILLSQKLVVGLLALTFLFNLNIFKPNEININIDIFRHEETNSHLTFFGVIYVDGEEGSIIIQMTKEETETTKDKNSTIIKDDKTPGRLQITIQNKKGEKVYIDQDYGSGEKSEFDKKIEQQVMDEVVNYIKGMSNGIEDTNVKANSNRLLKFINGFKNYCNK